MLPPHTAALPLPSRRLRFYARAARALLWLLLALWLLVGISWGLLHDWIVPRINEFRPRLEVAASHALGVPVHIGRVSARSNGLNPSFEFHDVALLDAAGRPALRLPQVVVGLSPLAISSWGIAQLVIDGAELDVRRNADGRLEVAGLDLAQSAAQAPNALSDWALSQPELVLRGGQLRWTDDMRAAPPLVLSNVTAVLRNSGQRHQLRLDATPPPAWGERFSLRVALREPFSMGRFTPTHGGQAGKLPWQHGTGELYAEFSRIDIAELRPYLDLLETGVDLASGQGAMRLWAELKDGQFSAATADLALSGVQARLSDDLKPLALASLSGRISGQHLATGFQVRSDELRFETEDKLAWPGGKLSLLHTRAEGLQPSRTELSADTLELATLAALAARMPLPDALHSALQSLAPQGRVEQLSARWQGPADNAQALSARGRVKGLTLAADTPSPAEAAPPGRPGVEQLDLDFELTPQGGKAQLAMVNGALTFPGVWSQPRLPMSQLSGQMKWNLAPKANGGDSEPTGYLARITQLSLSDLRVANADLAGRADMTWQPPAKNQAGQGGPGTVDLKASLSRGRAAALHRYLPQVLPLDVRRYLEGALLAGELTDVKLALKGDLQHFPFADPRHGDLKLSAHLRKVRLAYLPPSFIQPSFMPSTKLWPELEALDGELSMERSKLEVRQLQGRAVALPGLQLLRGNVRIADLAAPVVEIGFQVKGALAQGLQFVNRSPVSALLGDALAQTTATGPADYTMRLSVPLTSDAQTPVGTLAKTRFQATLVLPGNDVRFAPEAPLLGRLRGTLSLTEDSLRVAGAQARVLGGDLQFEGGQPAPRPGRADEPLQFRGQGTVTAEGLRQAGDAGPLAQLSTHATGSAAYTAVLGVRHGEIELKLNSPLTGLALNLPAPLGKAAAETLPLQIDRSVALVEPRSARPALQDQLTLALGDRAAVHYERALAVSAGGSPRVLRGSIALGLAPGDKVPAPAQGVMAKLQGADVDIDAWHRLLAPAAATTSGTHTPTQLASGLQPYLPTQLNVRAKSLSYQGYQLNDLVLGATRDGLLWHTHMESRELTGYAQFGQGSAASGDRVYARLSRLNLAAKLARDVEALLDPTLNTINKLNPASPSTQAVPALDIVVDDFELQGRKLGRLEVDAVNRPLPARDGNPREWRLNRLLLSNPEGVLTAKGSWAVTAPSTTSTTNTQNTAAARTREARRMALDFKLDVLDAGGLLKRLGMDGLVGRGKGRLEGQLNWAGSPLALDYPSLGGQFNVQIERGQFLKADPGIAKLLGVLSLQSLPRRLTLDFRDVFSDGFAFDVLHGDVRIDQGIASTRQLQMKGVNAAVMMEGSADIARETQQLQVLVIPEVNAGTASLLASIANPVVGVGTFLAQLFLRGALNNAATQAFTIDGPWSEPRITRVERRSPEASTDTTNAKP